MSVAVDCLVYLDFSKLSPAAATFHWSHISLLIVLSLCALDSGLPVNDVNILQLG